MAEQCEDLPPPPSEAAQPQPLLQLLLLLLLLLLRLLLLLLLLILLLILLLLLLFLLLLLLLFLLLLFLLPPVPLPPAPPGAPSQACSKLPSEHALAHQGLLGLHLCRWYHHDLGLLAFLSPPERKEFCQGPAAYPRTLEPRPDPQDSPLVRANLVPPEDPAGDKSHVRGTQENMSQGHGVPARATGDSLTTRPEEPGGPGSPTGPVGPGRPWGRKRSAKVRPHPLPATLTHDLGHSPVLVVLSLQALPAKSQGTL